ncbi:hypothetical protein N7474_002355 [Penicillium riverlandense]|uniref:uncharacterized protein n=1 Tax=Penicillium riverlandense TaxID=1903569 RepID=UPI002546DA38|nr:uncharacterized protein N7474_002355 [Penicillium riverlandense]KAJ5825217.1 hypothetical protein N7474_002355 [Penicillium riverlandense]
MPPRSHHGCVRCKRRRQKCDEQKPACGRCRQAEETCDYSVILKWNGRVPRDPKTSKRKQSFEIPAAAPDNAQLPGTNNVPEPQHTDLVHCSTRLDAWSALSSTTKLLLHHFITSASLISSHTLIRDQICRQILPLAHHSSSLMYATMALSALHRLTLLNNLPNQFIPEETVSYYMSASLRHLREELQTQNHPKQALLHTIRTLCHCEIYSGKADSSWRVHVNGARAIFESSDPKDIWADPEPSRWLWARWCLSIQALAAVTDIGLPPKPNSQDLIRQAVHEKPLLDIYTGYSADLNVAFMEIGAAAWKRQALDSELTSDDTAEPELQREADRLESMLQEMIRRDSEEGLRVPAHLSLSEDYIRQFSACNAAYQYSALIHLYRRVRKMSPFSAEVQECVRKTLDVVCGILPVEALSPWILLATPIYTAGLVIPSQVGLI